VKWSEIKPQPTTTSSISQNVRQLPRRLNTAQHILIQRKEINFQTMSLPSSSRAESGTPVLEDDEQIILKQDNVVCVVDADKTDGVGCLYVTTKFVGFVAHFRSFQELQF
jgi:hypothetical protein